MQRVAMSKWIGLCLVGSALIVWRASAQVQFPDKLGNAAQIDQFNFEKVAQFKKAMLSDQVDKAILRQAAEYFVYRTTWFDRMQADPKEMFKVRTDFEREMEAAATFKEAPSKLLAADLVACFKDVFKLKFDSNRLALVNAALMLPSLAQIKSEQIGDFLADLVADPKMHDAVRVHAARAMGEYFRLIRPKEQTILEMDATQKAKDVKRIHPLLELVDRKWDLKHTQPAAAQYIRREAVMALAQTKIPAVDVKQGVITAPIALALLRVLAVPAELKPPPSLGEKLEAAIGICQIKIDPNTDYRPEVGIYRVGRFCNELVKTYHQDSIGDFGGGDKKLAAPLMAWKFQAERLKQALKDLADNTANQSNIQNAHAMAQTLQTAMQPFLKSLSTLGRIENITDLTAAVNALQPKSPEVFRTIKEVPIGD